MRVSPGPRLTISGSHLAANANVELTWVDSRCHMARASQAGHGELPGPFQHRFRPYCSTRRPPMPRARSAWHSRCRRTGAACTTSTQSVNAVQVAHGGFVTLRTVTVTPTSGPIGTPVTITYSGLGASLYTGGASLLWDNHYVGEMMANWTRGVARATIRAAGPVGQHTIQVGNAISYLYLNVPQSPIPYTNGATATFTVTKDDGPPPSSIDWPVAVAPTLSARTTLQMSGLSAGSGVQAALATTSGR